ncbi:enoyl-CoA hydratase/isomerase family protein [Phototrophicus methaneseepsis]|uniref:Enoyl-CoA hydratase/isomerase family protein n=1 Tax=Phototrophicus methaneseepsis TaxID=2710758 RepID=A0A7S8E5C4_9CHLR|nr:enoyl-CoA hydratase/isomerase family protein [Phototrophicus methaneseepsis]QPC80664.1 enoyl-CoA hydratase/isomerase family protein [Phototrophicus methaneseepsis]
MYEFILTETHDQIFEIVLNRPDKRNAMNIQMVEEIGKAIDDAERAFIQGEARVLFIRAEGRVFSSGIDLTSFLEDENKYGENWRDNLFPTTADLQSVMNKIEDCSLPTFCLMHGYCLGLGMELALACDFRIIAERTKLALPESRLGMIPDVGGTTRLLRLVGPSRAKEIIMTGGNIDVVDAERWGIVNYVVPKDDLIPKAEALAKDIMLSAPLAVSYTKRTINDMLDDRGNLKIEAWAQAQLIRTEDFYNGVNAMINKTYPVEWKGK